MTTAVHNIIEHLSDNDIELVSYGLTPNPFGFCYERGDHTSREACVKLDRMLNALDESEERQLREWAF